MERNDIEFGWAYPASPNGPRRGRKQRRRTRKIHVAERFHASPVRRPATANALDRGYGYQVKSGSLDKIL